MTSWKLLLGTALILQPLMHAPAFADELVVELNNRVEALEQENREMRGLVEEMKHSVNTMTQKFETFSSDMEYRLSSGQGDATAPAPTPATDEGGPQQLGAVASDTSDDEKPSATKHNFGVDRGDSGSEGVTKVAVTPSPVDPKEAFAQAKSSLEQGSYKEASQQFGQIVEKNPDHKLAPQASYWMGVSYLLQGDYNTAASTFAKGYKAYPESEKAPDTLLKLAKSLAALGRTDNACTTLEQMGSVFPAKLTSQRKQEMKKLKCQ